MNGRITKDLKTIWTSIHNFPPVNSFISTVWYDSDPRTNEAVDMTEFEWRVDPFTPDEPLALAQVAKKVLIASSLARTSTREVLCEYFSKSETRILRAKFKDCSVEEQAFVIKFDSIPHACFNERREKTSVNVFLSCTFMFTCLRDIGTVQNAGFVSKRLYEAHQCHMKVHQRLCDSCGS
ncbi:hypothetical protein T265_04135 [Opisthorchis viverrini]|uniref:Uncharacterized protein n=1 Tax=Opisthorchis viverrini TaxID=6198 RepID=A0A074ZP84_OPIVI|nr:hypothetical protein T265_04135 [Opisthorchis viverrini]KER29203.1 hypothetical protein T265_04135 [Opisthorchis viverrini]